MLKIGREMLRPGAHGHVLWRTLQFELGDSVLSKEVDVQKGTGQYGSDYDRKKEGDSSV